MHRGLVFQNIAQKNDPRARFVVITWPKAAAQSSIPRSWTPGAIESAHLFFDAVLQEKTVYPEPRRLRVLADHDCTYPEMF